MKALLLSVVAALSLAAGFASADELFESQETVRAVINESEGLQVQSYCAWAPNDPSVCAGRATCKRNLRAASCARYCRINPYDVVCADAYRSRNRGGKGSIPHPWAPPARGFCKENPGNMACQNDTWWDFGF